MEQKLFSSFRLGNMNLSNRIVMAPMTRDRAIGSIPNELIALYYGQRASAGLIITEGTAPSPNALGYANIPGLFLKEQVEGWKSTTKAVHERGGKIFVQLMHTGRMAKPQFLPEGAEMVAPSAIAAAGKAVKNSQRAAETHTPRAMDLKDIEHVKNEFAQAALNAIDAGFDGVELHGANEHLIEQFLSPVSNQRSDQYGGSVAKRCRFVLELINSLNDAIGANKVGIRLSPYGMNSWEEPLVVIETYDYLTRKINETGIAYIHHVDHESMGGNQVPLSMKKLIRNNFRNTIILTGGFDKEKAELALQEDLADLIGFGRPFIGNPDFVKRLQNNWPINDNLDFSTFYTSDAKGYVDYETYKPQ